MHCCSLGACDAPNCCVVELANNGHVKHHAGLEEGQLQPCCVDDRLWDGGKERGDGAGDQCLKFEDVQIVGLDIGAELQDIP